ncbi:MAG: sigma-E processing peptidase SpoIIGA [Thermoanaerobacteraceae bacterium]|nr:sigma-E processing peptidase SpoIIGA [Thermoanaerobacteraceae bacterium]
MYIDVILLENIVFNYLILYITAVLAKYKSTSVRIFLGSLTGSLYVILMFIYRNAIFQTIPLKFMLSALIVVIVFYPPRLKDFIRLLSFFYLVSIIFGGVAFALYYLSGNYDSYYFNGVFVFNDFPVILIVITILIGCYLIFYCIEYVRKIRKNIIQMEILINSNSVTTNALVDTGNTLYEPISHTPVIIIEFETLKEILPESVNEYLLRLNQNSFFDFDSINNIDPEWLKRFRLLPFKDIGRENGMLLGIKPDRLKILGENDTKVIQNVILGIYFNKLSVNNEYCALLHTDLLMD